LEIAALEMGEQLKIDLFPSGEYGPDEIGKLPVARVRFQKDKDIEKDPLYGAMSQRATNRSAYDGDLLSRGEFDAIVNLAKLRHSDAVFVNDASMIETEYAQLFIKAFSVETLTKRTN